MANELDELYGMVTNEADKTALQQILARNPVAQERAEAQAALFAALATGDNDSIAAAQNRFARAGGQPNATPPPVSATSASTTLDELTRLATSRAEAVFDARFATREAEIRKSALADAKAEMQLEGGKLFANVLNTADQLYTIRRSHEREFGEDLDTSKLEQFVEANKGKYATYTAAHDAMVSEDRIQKRIQKGIDDAEAARATSGRLPGTTLIDSQSTVTPLPSMMRYNEKLTNPNGTNGSPRGTALDAAVKAWRETPTGRNGMTN